MVLMLKCPMAVTTSNDRSGVGGASRSTVVGLSWRCVGSPWWVSFTISVNPRGIMCVRERLLRWCGEMTAW